MEVEVSVPVTGHGVVLREIAALLREVTGEDEEWSDRITGTSRIEDDLRLESIELAALDTLLRERYGEGVDLRGLYAGLDLDEIVELTVGDLVALVERR